MAHTGLSRTQSARREDLITRLIGYFLEHGFFDTSIGELARELKCSKTTLYAVADSKEQIIIATVRSFFRRATERVESRMAAADVPGERIHAYLVAISEELAPASATFFRDLDMFAPTREIYRDNTRIAARRLQELVLEAAPETSRTEALFVGTAAAQVMEAIHRGDIEDATGLDDSAAYLALAKLVVGPSSPPRYDRR